MDRASLGTAMFMIGMAGFTESNDLWLAVMALGVLKVALHIVGKLEPRP